MNFNNSVQEPFLPVVEEAPRSSTRIGGLRVEQEEPFELLTKAQKARLTMLKFKKLSGEISPTKWMSER